MKQLKCFAGLFLAACLPLMAQDFRATLTGRVTDPSGAAVPNATVKTTSQQTNEVRELKATSEGVYTIPYLNPGVYNIEVKASGFQTLHRTDITLRVSEKLNLDLQLQVGEMSQQVTVSTTQELVETADAVRGLVFDPLKTQEYPLNGRQTYMLMSLTPGVIFQTETFGPTGNSGTRGWDTTNAYKINGARAGNNLFLLNGAPISDAGGTWQVAPNVEAVQEFKVMTNTYDAAYGRFQGGVVNTTLKSGTNDWHGNAFDFWRNRVLDANSFQNNYAGRTKGKHNQHQFGGVVGGPIRKDKDFIFASFEGWRERLPVPVTSDVPNMSLRDVANQQWTAFGYKIYDPLTTHACGGANEPCSSSTYYRNMFPGNVIPASRISPVGQKILSYFPAANSPNAMALNQNFIAANNTAKYFYNQPMVRYDHNFNASNKLYTVFTFQHGQEYRDSTGFGKPAGSGDVGSERTNQNYIVAYTRVLNANAVLDVRASFGRTTSMFPRYTDFDLTTDQIGMTNMIHAPTYTKNTVPVINLGGFGQPLFGYNGAGTLQSWGTYNQGNFAPSLTIVKGRHSFKTGFEYNYVSRGDASYGWSNGNFTFDQYWTRQQSDRGLGTYDGASIASLLIGTPTSGQIDYNATYYRSRPYYAGYFQDDWKINNKLTVNLGIRYEVQVPYVERYNRANRGFDPNAKNPYSDQALAAWSAAKKEYDATNPKYPYPDAPSVLTGQLLFAGYNGAPSRIYNSDLTTIAPRVGIAYRLNNKTVLRTGAGLFYNTPTNTQLTNGFSQSTSYVNSLDGLTPAACSSGSCLSGAYSLTNPFPTGIATPAGPGAATYTGNGISFEPETNRTPHTWQYSFGIQRELPGAILAEVSYTGNYQNHTNVSYQQDANTLADWTKAYDDNSYLGRSVKNPFYGILPKTTSLGSSPTISAGSLLTTMPLWNGATNNLIQVGHYRSDALQTKIEKRAFSEKGAGVMTYVVSYTFGKSWQADHRFQNWNLNEPLAYEIDDQDKTHNLAVSGVWDLPLGTGRKFFTSKNKVVKALADNWRTAYIFTYVSGYPVGWPNLVNYCGEWHAKNQSEYSWFNNDKSCYASQKSYVLRPMSDRFSDIRNPSRPQLTVTVEKTFLVTERYKLLVRGEAFNVTNTPIRPGPDTSFSSARFGMLPLMQNNFPRVFQLSSKFFF